MIRFNLGLGTKAKGLFFNSNTMLRSLSTSGLKPMTPGRTRVFTSNTNIRLTNRFPILQSAFKFKFQRYGSNKLWSFRRTSQSFRMNGPINWGSLSAPAIFTVGFCVCNTLATPYLFNYTPLSVLKSNPQAYIWGVIALNGAVFLMWKSPQFQRMLNKYFLVFKMRLGSPWSLLGAAFSHQNFGHLFVNMFVLQSFGTGLCMAIGVANFNIVYLNSAVISSFISLALPVIMRANLAVGSLGASGAIFSIFGIFSYLFPKAPIALLFIPIPGGAWMAFLGTTLYNVAGLIFRWGSFDYAAHLGGSIVGLAYGWWFNKKRKDATRRRRISFGF